MSKINNSVYSTYDYIDSLKEDKTNMVGHLNSIGVPVGESETFTELVKNIPNLVPKSKLSDLSITPTTFQQEFNHPDSAGYNQVIVEAVTSDIDPNIKAENIKKDISILGVKGSLESSILSNAYKVSSLDEMNSLTNVPDGAVCVVTDNSITDAKVDSHFQVATLPQQVVFDEPFTEFVDVRYRAVDESVMLDIMGNLDSNMFRMDGWGDIGGQPINIRIEYRSEDGGITYNRVSPEEDTFDFGTPIYYEMPEMWNDAIGKFLLIEEINFTGFFEYKNNSWTYYNVGINTLPKDYLIGVKAYNNDGIIKGTLISREITNTLEDTRSAYLVVNDLVNNVYSLKTILHDNKDFTTLFYGYQGEYLNITKILDTSDIERFESMFNGCSKLKSLDLSKFNTSKVITMAHLFDGCSELVTIDLSSFDTSNVTDMAGMFQFCQKITNLDLSHFNTVNLVLVGNMFANCNNLLNLNLSNFNTSKITNMYDMFWNCSSLTSLDLSSFNTSNVTAMSGMFRGCSSLTSLDLSSFNTSSVTGMPGIFRGCSSLNHLDISNFTFNAINDYREMFKDVPDDCEILVKSETEKQWITSKFANLTNVKVKEAI